MKGTSILRSEDVTMKGKQFSDACLLFAPCLCTLQFGIQFQGLASYCKAETTFTFHFSILALSNASLSINNRAIKSESGLSFALASQPFERKIHAA